ncbi:DUF3422 domain-containing protein [Rhodobacteraceae bacterium DSL-40]|uniref:DUF3422 family protein n=1 Tax=Amaricoccus sp. B4 TaxID=3368557 RepID=UPI000DAB9E64
MAQNPLPDHPMRYALANELHARPFPVLDPPCRAMYLAIKKLENAAERDRSEDRAHLIALLDRHGAPHPPPGADHYFGRLGRGTLKWEQHTEFVTYTLFAPEQQADAFAGELFNLFPRDWLSEAPGKVVTSCIVEVMSVAPEDREKTMARYFPSWFVPESLSVSAVADSSAVVAGDFQIDEHGHTRFAVLARPDTTPTRVGRVVQRVLEIETYKSMAMLTLPRARAVSATVARLDRELSDLATGMAEESEQATEVLHRLLAMTAEIEALSSATAFRFGAYEAYEAIVNQRIGALREERIADRQLMGEFMMRRFDPAMRTCRSAKGRLAELSGRAERAANLLRTRVDVANQAQNVEVLRKMDRRAALQLRLQETVEGLSVVAISYYAVNLAAGLLSPVGHALHLEKSDLVAILTLPVIAGVWFMVRRIRNRVASGHDEHG